MNSKKNILQEIKIIEKKYEELDKKFKRLKILETKNNLYLEKDKLDLLFLWEKYIFLFKKIRKLININKYRTFFFKINYEKMIIKRYLLIFYFNCLVDLVNNFGKHEEFIRILLSEKFKYDFGKIAKFIYRPTFINLINTPVIFLKIFKKKIDKKYFFMLKKEKNDIGKNKRFLTDYRNFYYYFKRRIYKILFFISEKIGTFISTVKFSSRKKGLLKKKNLDKYLVISKPGDIFLSRGNWNASNITIPGFWKHMSMYLGNGKFLKENFGEKYTFLKFMKDDFHYIIEATGEGVEIIRIENFIKHNDYLGISRTTFSEKKIFQSLEKAIGFYGVPYDFIFNFYSETNVICSELILKSYSKFGKEDEGLTIKLEKIKGSLTYPPNNFVEKISSDKNLKFIIFLDSIEKTGENFISNEKEFFKSKNRSRFSFMLK